MSINALGKRTTSSYDGAGRLSTIEDAENNLTEYFYDALGRQTGTVTPDGRHTASTYDGMDNRVTFKDSATNLVTYQYDALNRLSVTLWPTGTETRLYDEGGNLVYLKDAVNNLTTFAYDSVNRKIAQTDPLGQTEAFSYNKEGLLTSTTDRNGDRRDFSYDELNRLIAETWSGGGGSSFTYDANGNMLTASNANGSYAMTYDALNRVTVSKDVWNKTLTFTYDKVSNRTKVQDSFGGVETSVYDEVNRLSVREFGGITTTVVREEMDYLDNGQLLQARRYSDALGTVLVGLTNYSYDGTRLEAIDHYNGVATVLASLAYGYNADGLVTSVTANGVSKGYTYNTSNELTADGVNTYTYDGQGNRNNGSWDSSTSNQLREDGTWSYYYDYNGNLIKKTKGLSAETWTYGYDQKNQLIWAKDKATDGGTLLKRVDYSYDAFGNRIERIVDDDGDTFDDVIEYYAFFAGEVWADLDYSSSLTTRYVHGDGVDELLARVAANGTAAWLLTDHLGSVVAVTDNGGVLKDVVTYDAFGNFAETHDDWGGRFKWTGRPFDVTIGLQNNRLRDYDPKTGRWTTEDPSGLGPDSNAYRYVHNGYPNATDPSGLDEQPSWLDYLGAAARQLGPMPLIRAYFDPQGVADDLDLLTGGRSTTVLNDRTFGTVLDNVDQGFAGFSNVVTFGGSNALREAIWDETATRNHSGTAYDIGAGIGFGYSLLLGYGAARCAAAVPAGAMWAVRAAQGYATVGTVVGAAQSTYRLATDPENFGVGDALGFVPLAGAGLRRVGQMAGIFRWCFTSEMQLRARRSWVRWDELLKGDEVAACDENDPLGHVAFKRVLEVFSAEAPIWHVEVKGRTIRTTAEHRFYVWEKGWVPANELEPGDRFRADDERMLAVERSYDSGVVERVYNCAVEDFHTYFVGKEEWGFSLWAHNTCAGLHHYVPMFMGSTVQRRSLFGRNVLTWFEQIGHIGIHRAMNRYLEPLGMAYSSVRSGADIITSNLKTDRLKALVGFYKQYQGGAHFQGFLTELRATIRAGMFS